MKIANNNYTYEEIGVINTPETKEKSLRGLGMKVLKTMKSIGYMLSKDTIRVVVIYSNTQKKVPLSEKLIEKLMNTEHIAKYSANFPGRKYFLFFEDTREYKEIIFSEEQRRKDRIAERREDSLENYISLELDILNEGKRISEERKIKMTKYIRYYQLDLPKTEAEWYNTYQQIVFYIKNDVEYSFDKNLYYICDKCGELIRRGTEEEHVCWCDLAPAKTAVDYIINGERR